MSKYIGEILDWARSNNHIITYSELNDHLDESVKSQDEVDKLVELLVTNNVSRFEQMLTNVEKEELLREKIESLFESIKSYEVGDKECFDSLVTYYRAYDNRSFVFSSCSEIKQLERLDELGGILQDIYKCLC